MNPLFTKRVFLCNNAKLLKVSKKKKTSRVLGKSPSISANSLEDSCGAPSGVALAQYPSHISITFVHKSPYLSANIPAMADETRAVFSALDSAKTQLYHFKAVFVAGMTFFTIAYDLFSITAVTKLIYDPSKHYLWKPTLVNMDAITDLALCGTLAGKLFFRCLGDKLGRKKVYGITLVTIVGSAIASGLSFVSTAQCGITILCFSWFWLGFGIGGDYPLSAVIISDYANQKPQGAFSMEGMGILVAVAVAMIASRMFLATCPADDFQINHGDFVWRIVLIFGAVPAALTYYWRWKIPETARYTALIEGNHRKAAADMAKVLKEDIPFEEPTSKLPGFLLKILKWYALHLLWTAATSNWFLLDSAFYGAQPSQKDVFPAIGMVRKASRMNAIEKVFNFSKSMFIVALFATVHGYWFTIFLIFYSILTVRNGKFFLPLRCRLSGETEVPCSTEQILSWFLLAVNRSPRRFKACS